jgi:hypothetical protein
MATTLEEFSKTVFGSEGQLSLFYVIATASEDDLYAEKVGSLSGRGGGKASSELRGLVDVGLLEPVINTESRRKRYRRREPDFWSFIVKTHDRLA